MNRKQWKKIFFVLGVVFILAASFWYGGGSEGLQGFSISNENETELNQTKEQTARETDGETATEKTSDSDTSDGKLKEKENVFQQIVMHITRKKSASDTSKKTQNNKKAQKNANKAAQKSSKDSSKKKKAGKSSQTDSKNSSKSDKETASADTQTNRNDNSTETVQNNQPGSSEQVNNNSPATGDSDTTKCTIYISCATLLDNMDKLTDAKKKMVPADGVILKKTEMKMKKGSTVFDLLKNVANAKHIHLEYSFTPFYKSYYIEGIHNLYEFDAGELSGWMYSVNGQFQSGGCSEYEIEDGDEIKWVYTCNLGKDVGDYFEE